MGPSLSFCNCFVSNFLEGYVHQEFQVDDGEAMVFRLIIEYIIVASGILAPR